MLNHAAELIRYALVNSPDFMVKDVFVWDNTDAEE